MRVFSLLLVGVLVSCEWIAPYGRAIGHDRSVDASDAAIHDFPSHNDGQEDAAEDLVSVDAKTIDGSAIDATPVDTSQNDSATSDVLTTDAGISKPQLNFRYWVTLSGVGDDILHDIKGFNFTQTYYPAGVTNPLNIHGGAAAVGMVNSNYPKTIQYINSGRSSHTMEEILSTGDYSAQGAWIKLDEAGLPELFTFGNSTAGTGHDVEAYAVAIDHHRDVPYIGITGVAVGNDILFNPSNPLDIRSTNAKDSFLAVYDWQSSTFAGAEIIGTDATNEIGRAVVSTGFDQWHVAWTERSLSSDPQNIEDSCSITEVDCSTTPWSQSSSTPLPTITNDTEPYDYTYKITPANIPIAYWAGKRAGQAYWMIITNSVGATIMSESGVINALAVTSNFKNIIIGGTIHVNSNGKIYFSTIGSNYEHLDSLLSSQSVGFIANYSDAGRLIWFKILGSAVNDLSLDSANNIYVAGQYHDGNLQFNSGIPVPKVNQGTLDEDAFSCRLPGSLTTGTTTIGNLPDIDPDWILTAGGTGEDQMRAISIDSSHRVYMVGSYLGTAIPDLKLNTFNSATSTYSVSPLKDSSQASNDVKLYGATNSGGIDSFVLGFEQQELATTTN